eukprot:Skav211174  [mRNA]  locus=scaffold1363:257676:258071:- [translate_table: standard]
MHHGPETIFIGTLSDFMHGADHVWRYQLKWVGDQKIYMCLEPPSTTRAGDIMYIVRHLEGEKVFHVAYEGRDVDGVLEARAAVFRTEAVFWEVGEHVWETNALTSRVSYDDLWQHPQWEASGLRVRTQHVL